MELQEESGRYGVGQVVEEIAGVYHHIIQELCEWNISAPIKLCEAFVGRKSRVKKKFYEIYASLQPRFKNLRDRSCLITHKLDGATGGIFSLNGLQKKKHFVVLRTKQFIKPLTALCVDYV